jgi:hypothetical protein
MPAGDDLPSLLGLDRELVAAAASATEDYARHAMGPADGDTTTSEASIRIASAFTRAGILWCLLDPERARPLFREAASEHRELGRPRAAIFDVLASPREPPPMPWATPERPIKDLPDVHGVLLATAWPRAVGAFEGPSNDDPLSSLIDDLSEVQARPTGRLRLPLRLYIAIARASAYQPGALPGVMTEMLGRAFDATAALLYDKGSLTALRPGILPLDPEVLALSVLATMSYHRTNEIELSRAQLELPEPGLAPLWVAERLAGIETA